VLPQPKREKPQVFKRKKTLHTIAPVGEYPHENKTIQEFKRHEKVNIFVL